jgi:hypothetical protein
LLGGWNLSAGAAMIGPITLEYQTMRILPLLLLQVVFLGLQLAGDRSYTAAAESTFREASSLARRATFKLTYANRDLQWHGDPASPVAWAYLKPGARPIATDFCLTTTLESRQAPVRRYLHESRIAQEDDRRTVYAFTERREKVVGTIEADGRFVPNDFYHANRGLLPSWPADPSVLKYDARENALYEDCHIPGPEVTETLDFLPLQLTEANGKPAGGQFAIQYAPARGGDRSADSPSVSLVLQRGGQSIKLAEAVVPRMFRRDAMSLGSFDNQAGTYLPEAAYRAAAGDKKDASPSVTVTLPGTITSSIVDDSHALQLASTSLATDLAGISPAKIAIDGNFDDWRNVAGVDDPLGDLVPYLEYVPDVDLLEFKVSHDNEHIYLYARVAGQVGRSHPAGGRSYFYAYMDVDQNAGTGFLPTRDDECYYGVDIGDDCEVQFEFVENKFRKTFYGFCGLGGDVDVLNQKVTIGKSHYGRFDADGRERKHYKSEYIYRGGATEITEDLKLGTSDSIHLAVSPDGCEVEIASHFAGFLKDPQGRPIVRLGQTIDLAAGMECDSKAYLGKTKWAADSTIPIRGYELSPIKPDAAKQTAVQ